MTRSRSDVFFPPEADEYRCNGLWRRETTLVGDLVAAADRHPDKTALVSYRGRDATRATYQQLADRVHRAALLLQREGVGVGDVVTIQLPNSVELVVLCLAANALGAIPAPVLPAMRTREVRFVLEATSSPIYIGTDSYRGFSMVSMMEDLAPGLPALRRVLIASANQREDHAFTELHRWEKSLEDFSNAPSLHEMEVIRNPDEIAQLMYTSGTTGEPKGVMHSHNTLYAMNLVQAQVMGLNADTVTCMGSPTTHQAGYTWNLVMPLILGATAVQVNHWNPEEVLDVIETEHVTFFMGAPVFLSDLIATQRKRRRDLTSLKSFVTGSAPIAPHLAEAAQDVLGTRLYSEWGMTENGCVTVTRREDPQLRASESDGTVVPGMRIRLIASGGGPIDDQQQIGELQVRGIAQCLGYFDRAEVYRESLSEDGWFRTGDLARWVGPDEIRICGRSKDVISRGGEKIPVAEVESAILAMDGVVDIAVVAVPDERLGERACAVMVVENAAPTLDGVVRHLEAVGMAKIYWPEELCVVSELPRTTTGKVKKFLLRETMNGAVRR